jgi:hypothetical protein
MMASVATSLMGTASCVAQEFNTPARETNETKFHGG